MAIAFQTATTVSLEGSGGSGSVTKPSGTVDGDFLVAGYINEQGSITPTISGTWTVITSVNMDPTHDIHVRCWYRRAASEPASYTITSNSTYGDSGAAFMLRYTGVKATGDPIRTSGTSSGSSPLSGPTLSSLQSTDLAIQVCGATLGTWGGEDITLSGPGGGWTQRANIQNTTGDSSPTLCMLEQFNQGTGPSFTGSTTGIGMMLAAVGFALIEEPAQSLSAKSYVFNQQAIRRAHNW